MVRKSKEYTWRESEISNEMIRQRGGFRQKEVQ